VILKQQDSYRWIILGTLFMVHVLTSIGQFSIPPLLPFIKKNFELNYTQVGIFSSSFYLGLGAMAAFGGSMSDFMGIKKLIILGTLFMGALMLIASLMTDFWWIIGFLICAGISYSAVTPATNKATMYWFQDSLRATAMGAKQTGINAGGFIAAFIVPWMAVGYGWHLALSFTSILVGASALVMLIFYREFHTQVGGRATFETWKAQYRRVISNRSVLFLGVEGFFRVGLQNTYLAYLILYLQKAFELSIMQASLFLALTQLSGAFGRILWGLVSDRTFGGQRKVVYQLIAVAAGILFLLLGYLPPTTPIWVIVLLVFLLGITAVGHQGVGLSLLGEVAGKELTGTASGFNQSFYFLGVVLMAPFFGFMVDTFKSYHQAWFALALFAFIAASLVLFVKEESKKGRVPVVAGEAT
jgi:MFS transporter, ACS family, hexuronate transporter